MSEEQYKTIFSQNLKKWMADRIVTQQQLADAIGVGQSTVSAWCNGEKMPRMGKIEMMADYFGINKSDLLEIKEDNDDFRDRMRSEYGAIFDLVDKADPDQRQQIEKILDAIVPKTD